MLERYDASCAVTTLAVLAGGQSRRMGVAKAHLQFEGVPILEFLHKQIMWPGATLLVDAPGREKPPGYELFDRVVTDPIANEGPLRGVLTALEHTRTSLLVVIPIDMPCLTIEALGSLAAALNTSAQKSLAMFERDGQIEPLPAAFAVQQARSVIREQLLSHSTSLHGLTNVMNTAFVQPDPSWPKTLWVNLNHPADVEEYLQSNRIGAVR